MARAQDPSDPIRRRAETLPGVTQGTSCNQDSFKAGKASFLFVGPGAKGKGFKAMFKLERSMAQARKLAKEEPDRFQVGSTGWVTTRFTAEDPLPKSIWEKWLRESYELSGGAGPGGRETSGRKAAANATSRNRTSRKRATKNG